MNKFHILHYLPSIDRNFGGPSKSVPELCNALAGNRCNVELVTLETKNNYEITNPNEGFSTLTIKSKNRKSFNFLKQYSKILRGGNYQIWHTHGLWDISNHITCKLAQKRKIPYVITPRGMLEPWSLKQKKWKKKFAMAMYQKKDLVKASCIHATSEMEAKNIRQLGIKTPVTIIPNGIDLKNFPKKIKVKNKPRKTLLFLSRIHKKKGINLLIDAWASLDKSLRNNWQIEIVGNGEESYINFLENEINSKKLNGEIKIIKAKYGNAKIKTYHQADLFVLPTHSENFGIVVAEALACGVPVITTKGAPWEELKIWDAGWWIDIGAEPLKKYLNIALNQSSDRLFEMGYNGRKLIEKNYSIESVGNKMSLTYEWILTKTQKPNFII